MTNGASTTTEVFYVTVADESEGAHEVTYDEDGDFVCNDCGADGLSDGFSGAQQWHDSL